MFRSNLAAFARAAVPAALVNSGLKYMQVSVDYSATTTGNRFLMKDIKLVNCLINFVFRVQALISLAFQQRLTQYLHECYLSNRVYYVASTLRGLSNADQV